MSREINIEPVLAQIDKNELWEEIQLAGKGVALALAKYEGLVRIYCEIFPDKARAADETEASHARYAEDARQELLSGDPIVRDKYFDRAARDRRLDRSVWALVRKGPLPTEVVDVVVQTYANRLAEIRKEVEARTGLRLAENNWLTP